MVVDVGRLQIMENLRSIPKIAIAASSAEHYVMSTNSDNSRAPLPDDGSAGQQGKCQQYLHLFILQRILHSIQVPGGMLPSKPTGGIGGSKSLMLIRAQGRGHLGR